jgi:hypothetical protein
VLLFPTFGPTNSGINALLFSAATHEKKGHTIAKVIPSGPMTCIDAGLAHLELHLLRKKPATISLHYICYLFELSTQLAGGLA